MSDDSVRRAVCEVERMGLDKRELALGLAGDQAPRAFYVRRKSDGAWLDRDHTFKPTHPREYDKRGHAVNGLRSYLIHHGFNREACLGYEVVEFVLLEAQTHAVAPLARNS